MLCVTLDGLVTRQILFGHVTSDVVRGKCDAKVRFIFTCGLDLTFEEP